MVIYVFNEKISQFSHSHKKRRDSLETRWRTVNIFAGTWNIWGGRTEHQKGNFCEELLGKNDFEAISAILCCYDHGAKASEAVQKIATDQKSIANAPCVL